MVKNANQRDRDRQVVAPYPYSFSKDYEWGCEREQKSEYFHSSSC